MKRLSLLVSLSLVVTTIFGQLNREEQERDSAFYNATGKWFSAWQLVCKEIFKVQKLRPVEFVFFDDKYVYSTSAISISNGSIVKGRDLMNLSFQWKKMPYGDSLILPDRSVAPVRLMSFAAEVPGETNKSFFVMPLPGFWEANGLTSKELGAENLITGVFIHEFSHSQQMQNFGKSMTKFEKENSFGVEFSDDIVQNLFSKDSSYVSGYKEEVHTLFLSTRKQALDKTLAKDGIKAISRRQAENFKTQLYNLTEIDKFFLTMEGLGQYAMYLWLIDPRGAGIKKELAIEGVRRGGRWWSQDEGFALFLILDKLSKPSAWAPGMFGDKTESVIDLINKLLD